MSIIIKRSKPKGYQATSRYKITYVNGDARWRMLTPLSADRLSQRAEVKSVERAPWVEAKPARPLARRRSSKSTPSSVKE